MICIVDYQMGNLRSVQKALQRAGHETVVSADPSVVRAAEKVVLPGVGAFGDAMRELTQRGLLGPIRDSIQAGKPFLGICLGLQLLFDVSHEGGLHEGLGVCRGEVRRFTCPAGVKVPHMGWNALHIQQAAPLLEGIPDGTYFYFVHSFVAVPADGALVAGTACYPDPFCAMIWRDNLYATQFHPEKSQAQGRRLLDNFGRLQAGG